MVKIDYLVVNIAFWC